MNEKNDVPMIELHKVDTTMAYASKIVRDVKIIVAIVMAAIIAIIYIFVSKYNERTSDWLKTFNMLISGQTEVTDGNTEEIQQYAPP